MVMEWLAAATNQPKSVPAEAIDLYHSYEGSKPTMFRHRLPKQRHSQKREPVLKSLKIKDFTVFNEVDLEFSKGLNVIVGANGTGKTHLLKLPYAVMAVGAKAGRKRNEPPTKSLLQARIAEKIFSVFRPEDRLGRLVHRQLGSNMCSVQLDFIRPRTSLAFRFSSLAKSQVVVETALTCWFDKPPVFLPNQELLTVYPGFVPLYKHVTWNSMKHGETPACYSGHRPSRDLGKQLLPSSWSPWRLNLAEMWFWAATADSI